MGTLDIKMMGITNCVHNIYEHLQHRRRRSETDKKFKSHLKQIVELSISQ